jgi:hypothetical protein
VLELHGQKPERGRAPQGRLAIVGVTQAPDLQCLERAERGLEGLSADRAHVVIFQPATVGNGVLHGAFAIGEISHQREQIVELVERSDRHRHAPCVASRGVEDDAVVPVEGDLDLAVGISTVAIVAVDQRPEGVAVHLRLTAFGDVDVANERTGPGGFTA